MDLAHRYHRIIEWIIRHAPATDKFVHVQAGLIIWIAAALLLRKSLRSPVPLLVLGLAEAVNEGLDRLYAGSWSWPDTRGDILATMLWPLVLAALLHLNARLRR